MFPSLPAWDSLHPLVIHFPIALLLVAPLLVLLSLALRSYAKGLGMGAFVLMLLGTVGSYVAVATGQAAAMVADQTPEITQAIAAHGELGEDVRMIFTILTVLYGALLFALPYLKRPLPVWLVRALYVAFLVAYAGGMLVLVNTAHRGGMLVHHFGLHAML